MIFGSKLRNEKLENELQFYFIQARNGILDFMKFLPYTYEVLLLERDGKYALRVTRDGDELYTSNYVSKRHMVKGLKNTTKHFGNGVRT